MSLADDLQTADPRKGLLFRLLFWNIIHSLSNAGLTLARATLLRVYSDAGISLSVFSTPFLISLISPNTVGQSSTFRIYGSFNHPDFGSKSNDPAT